MLTLSARGEVIPLTECNTGGYIAACFPAHRIRRIGTFGLGWGSATPPRTGERTIRRNPQRLRPDSRVWWRAGGNPVSPALTERFRYSKGWAIQTYSHNESRGNDFDVHPISSSLNGMLDLTVEVHRHKNLPLHSAFMTNEMLRSFSKNRRNYQHLPPKRHDGAIGFGKVAGVLIGKESGGMRERWTARRSHAEAVNPAAVTGWSGRSVGIQGPPAKASQIAVKALTACLRAVERYPRSWAKPCAPSEGNATMRFEE